MDGMKEGPTTVIQSTNHEEVYRCRHSIDLLYLLVVSIVT
jgi:hypothetical protein